MSDYWGVRPACGCVTAWIGDPSEDELSDFAKWMKATDRDVLTTNGGDGFNRMRTKLDRCPHRDFAELASGQFGSSTDGEST